MTNIDRSFEGNPAERRTETAKIKKLLEIALALKGTKSVKSKQTIVSDYLNEDEIPTATLSLDDMRINGHGEPEYIMIDSRFEINPGIEVGSREVLRRSDIGKVPLETTTKTYTLKDSFIVHSTVEEDGVTGMIETREVIEKMPSLGARQIYMIIFNYLISYIELNYPEGDIFPDEFNRLVSELSAMLCEELSGYPKNLEQINKNFQAVSLGRLQGELVPVVNIYRTEVMYTDEEIAFYSSKIRHEIELFGDELITLEDIKEDALDYIDPDKHEDFIAGLYGRVDVDEAIKNFQSSEIPLRVSGRQRALKIHSDLTFTFSLYSRDEEETMPDEMETEPDIRQIYADSNNPSIDAVIYMMELLGFRLQNT